MGTGEVDFGILRYLFFFFLMDFGGMMYKRAQLTWDEFLRRSQNLRNSRLILTKVGYFTK